LVDDQALVFGEIPALAKLSTGGDTLDGKTVTLDIIQCKYLGRIRPFFTLNEK